MYTIVAITVAIRALTGRRGGRTGGLPLMSSKNQSAALTNLVDASAGAAGSLLNTLCLYPLDLSKTIVQSGKSPHGALQTGWELARDEGLLRLFKGVGPKAVHAVAQNFIYFYLYATLKSSYAAAGLRTTTLSNTVLGIGAGILNLTVTLPLETVVVRVQTSDATLGESIRALIHEGNLWRGLPISSLLTLNPALNFSIFDAFKLRLLKWLSSHGGRRRRSLSVAQAFILGATSKVISTLLTYPLIRAKTLMQTAEGDARERPIWKTLAHVVREEGVEGLYRGFYAQIFSAVAKSGILLTTKEQLFRFAMGLILVLGRRRRRMLAAAAHAPVR